nr:hypothetical protein [Synergistaceae bacterium]
MALDDIFIDEEDDESKLPELVRLRNKRGWSQYQIALAVNLNIIDYSDIEYGRVENPEIKERAKKILNSDITFNPYLFLPKVPDFKPEQEYVFMLKNRNKEIDVKSKMIRHLIFVSPCKGAHDITHYLFKHKCGYLECFTQVQLMDYKIEVCKE